MINPNYKKPKTGAGELKIPVSFFGYKPVIGPEPGDEEQKLLYRATCETYNPSMKDMEVLQSTNTKRSLTIIIRDPMQDYQPTNKHIVEVEDYHFMEDDEFLRWNIINVSQKEENFLKIILGISDD